MRFYRDDSGTIVLIGLNSLCCGLLLAIRRAASLEDPAAQKRLYSSPGVDQEFEREWQQYVEPELRQMFRGALDVIDADLASIATESSEELRELRLPLQHLEAWIHGLNQARLALAAHHDFTEAELQADAPVTGDERAFALFQCEFYAMLMDTFLRVLDEEAA